MRLFRCLTIFACLALAACQSTTVDAGGSVRLDGGVGRGASSGGAPFGHAAD